MNYRKFSFLFFIVVICAGLILAIMAWNVGNKRSGILQKGESVELVTKTPQESIDNPERIRQAYEEGKVFQQTMAYHLHLDGRHKSWGLDRRFNAVYAGVTVTDHTIEHNDGKNITSRLRISEAKTVKARKEFDEIKIELGERAHKIVTLLGWMVERIPVKLSKITEKGLNMFLGREEVRKLLALIPLKTVEIEALEGFEFRLEYLDGQGVQRVTLLDTPQHRTFEGVAPYARLNDIEDYFSSFDPNPDVHIFPDEDVEIGDIWRIRGRKLPNIFPPTLNGQIEGEVTLRREEDEDSMIKISILGGDRLILIAQPKRSIIEGQFTLNGEMYYDRDESIVKHGTFKGKIPVFGRSTEHWIFEMEHESTPFFEAEYRCEVY